MTPPEAVESQVDVGSKGRAIPDPVLLATTFLAGFAALTLQVLALRQLSVVLGSTTFAVSTVLAAFMAGLGLGSYLASRPEPGWTEHPSRYALLYLGLAGAIPGAFAVLGSMDRVYFVLSKLTAGSFSLALAGRFLIAFAVLVVPCVLLGTIIPAAAALHSEVSTRLARGASRVYSANTFGSVAGALVAATLLVPSLGTVGAVAAASAAAACGWILVGVSCPDALRLKSAPTLAVLAAALVGAAILVPASQPRFAFGYDYSESWSSWSDYEAQTGGFEPIFWEDDAEGTVSVFLTPTGDRFIQINGLNEGSTASQDDKYVAALLPRAYRPEARSALVIGLGTGATLEALTKDATYSALEAIEINKILPIAVERHFWQDLRSDPRVRLTLADARNQLLLSDRQYDVIVSQPSVPNASGVSNLFTLEFFQLVRDRLTADGVFVQWLPVYLYTREDVDILVKTVGTVFDNVHVWQMPETGDLFLVASASPLPADTDRIGSAVLGDLRACGFGKQVSVELRRDAEEARRIVSRTDLPLNTDDSRTLEMRAAVHRILGLTNRHIWDPESGEQGLEEGAEDTGR